VAGVDSWSRLALEAGGGDAESLKSLVEHAYEQVRRLCSSLVDEKSADDLAQETFVRVVRSLSSYQGRSSARTWLLSIARHTCLDEIRARERGRRRDRSLSSVAEGEEWGPDAGQKTVVMDLLRQLEPNRRTAFVLTQMLGLSYEDTAAVCECPVGTIRSRVARARTDLVEALELSDRVPDSPASQKSHLA